MSGLIPVQTRLQALRPFGHNDGFDVW